MLLSHKMHYPFSYFIQTMWNCSMLIFQSVKFFKEKKNCSQRMRDPTFMWVLRFPLKADA